MRLPNIVIAGTVKAGTTSLFSYLSQHPDICSSSIKETCHFLPLRYGEELQPIDKYMSYFKHCRNERYVVEATPGYFEGGRKVAEELKKVLGDTKILIALRDPVDRLVSFYRYQKAQVNLPKDISLEEYVRQCNEMPFVMRQQRASGQYWGVDGGIYSRYLEEWFEVFGSDNIRILFFEDLSSEPLGVMRELCKWLNIDAGVYDSMNFSVENRTVPYKFALLHRIAIKANATMESFLRQHSGLKIFLRDIYYSFNSASESNQLSSAVEQQLKHFYADSNQKVEWLLKKHGYQDLPHWLTGGGIEVLR